MKLIFFAASLLIASFASAQELECEKPEIPGCAWKAEVWLDEVSLQGCQTETDAVFAAMKEYRECLWEYRDDAIFLVDNKLAHMVAEMAAMTVFSECRMAAGPNATLEDIQRCPVPEFVQD